MCNFYSTVFLLVFSSEMQQIGFLVGNELSYLLPVAKKKLGSPSNPHLICHSGFDSGVIFVTLLYSFLMLILCDQLFIFITTVHRYFLSNKNLPGYSSFCPCLAFSCFLLWYVLRHTHAQHFRPGCDQKKITPCRNFF